MKIKGADLRVGDVVAHAGRIYMIREVSDDMRKLHIQGTQPIFIGKDGITEITNRQE